MSLLAEPPAPTGARPALPISQTLAPSPVLQARDLLRCQLGRGSVETRAAGGVKLRDKEKIHQTKGFQGARDASKNKRSWMQKRFLKFKRRVSRGGGREQRICGAGKTLNGLISTVIKKKKAGNYQARIPS